MSDLKHLVFEYRRLLHRFEWNRGEMSEAGLERLRSLDRLFSEEPGRDRDRRQHARCDHSGTATMQMGRAMHQVRIVDLGGGGLCLTPPPPLKAGERGILHIPAEEYRQEYQYTVEVAWIRSIDGEAQMGVVFCDAPRMVSAA